MNHRSPVPRRVLLPFRVLTRGLAVAALLTAGLASAVYAQQAAPPAAKPAPAKATGTPVPLGTQQATTVARPAGNAEALALDQRILSEAKKGTEIMQNLGYLSDIIGPRLTGSPALRRANDWAAERMRGYGLANVHLEPWTIPAQWERGPATAKIIEPDNGRSLTVAAMGWTPGTHGKVQGDVVIMDVKTSADLAKFKGRLKNAIVLRGAPSDVRPITDRSVPGIFGGPPGGNRGRQGRGGAGGNMERVFSERMALQREMMDFMRAEGAAVIMQDAGKPQGLLTTTGGWRGTDRPSASEPVPALFVAHEHYALLYRLAQRPAPARTRVEVEIQNKITPGPVAVYNVVGELRGTEKPDEFVVLGAHLDSWDLAQGTTDNGTGTCVVLEAARLLKKSGVLPKRTIRFVLFTGEEQGLHGSRAYVEQHKAEMPKVSMCLVHDTGTGKVTGIGLQGREIIKPILEAELTSLKELGVTDINMRAMGGSDHASFERGGVPGFAVQQDMAEYRFTHHSQSDTLDKAHEPDLVQGAEVMAITGLRVANLPALLPRDKPQSGERPRQAARAPASSR
jgi:hypothetical protein